MTESQLVEKIKTLVKEKAEILEKMSQYDQKVLCYLHVSYSITKTLFFA